MAQVKYRPDIDGLRAVAVLLVLIFHAGFSIFPGGYVGVDIFFVISGYLITGILLNDIEEKQFKFTTFYKRRIRRLMPALFGMLLITTIIASIILLPSDFSSYGKSLISVVLSLSNIYFWRENGGYFEGNVEEVPLLHTWSLSVEEQFYLLWPLMMLIFSRHLKHSAFLLFLLFVIICSVVLSQWVSEVTFAAAYYLLPTRIFELLIGAILVLSFHRLPNLSILYLNLLAFIGLVCILSASLILNSESSFPGYNALLPTIGTALLLYTGAKGSTWINQCLSFGPLVWIGLISYSLYLWHWPLIVFIRYTGFELTIEVSIIIVVLSILLGWISWKYIETPFRVGKTNDFKHVFSKIYLVPSAVIIIMGLIFYVQNGLPQRFDSGLIKMEAALNTKPGELRAGCHSPSRLSEAKPSENCWFGDLNNKSTTALLVGDSHGNHFTGFIDELTKVSGIAVKDYTLDECLPIFGLKWGHNPHYSQLCESRNDLIKEHIKESKFGYIILSGYWPSYEGYHYIFDDNKKIIAPENYQSLLSSKFNETLQAITEQGSIPVIIKDSSPNGSDSPACAIKKRLYNEGLECNIDKKKVDHRDEMINSLFSQLKLNFPELIVIDPKEAMCDQEICYSSLDDIPLFIDQNHLNDEGSRIIGRRYLELTDNPFMY
jgi:peptidoglycan/LPS O-acetylase OafA/YrhL